MKRLLIFLGILLSILTIAEVGVYNDKIVIGTFQALSGPYAVIGQEMSKGMNAYFNWVNKNTGVYGRKIELIIADDQLNPSKTVVEVKRLVESDKVFAIVGGLGSYGCLAVMDYLEQNRVPFVYQGAGTSLLVNPPKRYIFAVQPDYTFEGQLIAKFLVENLSKKRIGIIYMSNDVGEEGRAAVKARLEKYKMKPVIEVGYNPLETDYSALAINVLNANVDSIVIYGFITDTVRWIKTLRDYGVAVPVVTTYSNADPSFITLGGKQVEGVYLTGWVPLATPDRPEFLRDYQRAVAIFQETYPNQPMSSYAVAGFIAAEVFVQGLLRAGSTLTREGLVQALETFKNWNGILTKDITWGPNLRRGKSSMYFMKIEKGIFVSVTDLMTLQD